MREFDPLGQEISDLLEKWKTRLASLPPRVMSDRHNKQHRNIKQIVGHMIDSASNNVHRIVHLQYGDVPLQFPNYATHGNNDRWIAIQNYDHEDVDVLLGLWYFSHLHIIHVIRNVDPSHLQNQWYAGDDVLLSLQEMIMDFPRHFKLHIREIEELIHSENNDIIQK